MNYNKMGTMYVVLKLLGLAAVITPIMPKLKIGAGIYVYPLEVVLLVTFPILLIRPRVLVLYRAQRWLLVFWCWMLVTTAFSYIAWPNNEDILRVVKGIIYVPLVSAGARAGWKVTRRMACVGVIALLLNIVIHATWIVPSYGFDPWDVRTALAGMNNKYISLVPFEMGVIPRGAAGIWGSYGVLVLVMAMVARQGRRGDSFVRIALYMIILLLAVTLGLSVSREALFVLLSFLMLGGLWLGNREVFKVLLSFAVIAVVGMVTARIAAIEFPIIRKIEYMIEPLKHGYVDSNILARVNVWRLTLLTMKAEPWRFLTGFGYNRLLFAQSIERVAGAVGVEEFATSPESAVWQALAFGGLPALIAMIGFVVSVVFVCLRSRSVIGFLFGCYFLGLVAVNIVSGASMFGDLLYGQMLLAIGVLYRQVQETGHDGEVVVSGQPVRPGGDLGGGGERSKWGRGMGGL